MGGLAGCLGNDMRHGDRPRPARASVGGRTGRADWSSPACSCSSAALRRLPCSCPVGHGFAPKGGGWFIPAVVGGVFTLHPLLVAVPWAACFVFGLADWRHPWRVEHLDLLALAGFFPVAMLLSDDAALAGLWLAAACLCWLFCRMLGVALGICRMPELRPSFSSRRLGLAILLLLLVRLASLAGSNILDVGQASSLGAWRLLHGLHLYGAVSWQGPAGLQIYRPDSYGPFAYYAYLPFAALFPAAPAVVATLLPAVCFDALTLAGLYKLGGRLGGRQLARAFVFAYLLFPFPDLSLMAETNDALIAALCVWTIAVATERPVARGLLMAAATLTKFLPGLLALQFLGVRQGRAALRADARRLARRDARLAGHHLGPGSVPRLDGGLPADTARRRRAVQHLDLPAARGARGKATARRRAGAARALSPGASSGSHPREQAALAAALLIGAQLLIGYWFYSYLTWCYPLLVIAVIRARPEPGAASTGAEAASAGAEAARAEAACAGAACAGAARAEAARAEGVENASAADLAETVVL